MKKSLFLVTLLLVAVMAFGAKEDNYLLYANFENGSIPEGWTQEKVSGDAEWVVESGANAMNPSGAYNGDYRLAIRNTSSQTQHFVTRLVSPVMNLSSVHQPILVFSHAQQQWAGDVDELRVYYRPSADSRWIELVSYMTKINSWQTDTIVLTAATSTYQLAFEVTDNLGKGVVMDDIIVRPIPSCTDPSGIQLSGLTGASASMYWSGSFDTDSFHVILSETELSDPSQAVSVVADYYVYDFKTDFTNLSRNTKYYYYIQAICGADESAWARGDFTTRNLIDIPYTQNFDMPYLYNVAGALPDWTYVHSTFPGAMIDDQLPFINQLTARTSLSTYSYNATTSMIFSGGKSFNSVPLGHYVCASTPELDVEKISDVQVSFWGTASSYVGQYYASGIIVGVMEDPTNFSTFTAVDTVYEREYGKFNKYFVSFANYKGTGKYIAFASNFLDKANFFSIDDVVIEPLAETGLINNTKITGVGTSSFSFDAEFNGVSEYKVIVANPKVDANGYILSTVAGLQASDILASKTYSITDTKTFAFDSSLQGKSVQIYLVPTKGDIEGANALPVKLQIPMKWNGRTLLVNWEQEDMVNGYWRTSDAINYQKEYNNVTYYPVEILTSPTNYGSLYPTWPSSIGYGRDHSQSIHLVKERQVDGGIRYEQTYGDYIAFPEVDNIKDIMLEFYLRPYADNSRANAKVAVGVMSDPLDPSTFEAISYCENYSDQYIPCIVTFDKYTGNSHYPAIMAVDAAKVLNFREVSYNGKSTDSSVPAINNYYVMYTSYQYIDDITMKIKDNCLYATETNAIEYDTHATITWKGNDMSKWIVRYSENADMTDNMLTAEVTKEVCELTNLLPHHTYYYQVLTLCEDDTVASAVNSFKTNCLPEEQVPYFEGFENYVAGTTSTDLPDCWTIDQQKVSSTYKPYIGSTPHSGQNALAIDFAPEKSSSKPLHTLALPKMDTEINKLELSFWLKNINQGYADTLYIGVMSDPTDESTFEKVSFVQCKQEYVEYVVRFTSYKGTGKYIAFYKPESSDERLMYLDDVQVTLANGCEKVQDVTVHDLTINGATIMWNSGESNEWQVLLSTSKNTPALDATVDGTTILGIYNSTQNEYKITQCPNPNTTYYVFVRSLCGNDLVGEWSFPASFKTVCEPQTVDEIGLITLKSASDLGCWTLGVREGASPQMPMYHSTYRCLYIYDKATTDGAYAIMPPVDVDSITRLQVSFEAHGGTSADWLRQIKVGIISNPSDLSTFTSLATIDLNRVSAMSSTNNYGFNEAVRYVVRFDDYKGDYNGDFGKQVMFISESGDKVNGVYINNIRIDTIATCVEPLSITIEPSAYEANVSWDRTAGNYQVQLLDANGQVVADQMTTTENYKFENLQYLTSYIARVRTICGVGDTSVWSPEKRFSTTCPPAYPLPYEENFDYATISTSVPYTIPNCWNTWYNNTPGTATSTYARIYTSAKKDGKAGLYLASTKGNAATPARSAYAVLPKLADDINKLMISFDYKATSKVVLTLKLGVSAHNEDLDSVLSTVEWIDTIQSDGTTNWQYYAKDLACYKGTNEYLVIACVDGSSASATSVLYAYIDNLYIEYTPSCIRPTGLASIGAGAHTLSVTWSPIGNEQAWDVACVASGGDISTATITSVTETKATVEGLTSATDYDIYVRANCGNDDVSQWLGPLKMSTLFTVSVADAHWDFEGDASVMAKVGSGKIADYLNYKSWKTCNTQFRSQEEVEPDFAPYIYPIASVNVSSTTAPKYGYNSNHSLGFYSMPKMITPYAMLPLIDGDMDTLQLRFKGASAYISNRATGNLVSYIGDGRKLVYPHSIKVGVLSNPDDWSTLEYLQEFVMPEVDFEVENISQLSSPDEFWDEFTLSLCGTNGKNIVFYSDYSSFENYVWIDDVVIEKETGCSAPIKLTIDSMAYNKATISWLSGKKQWNVKVTDSKGQVVSSGVVSEHHYTVTGLEASGTYTFAAQSICEEDSVSPWASITFTTPCAALEQMADLHANFEDNLEEFQSNSYIPSCWLSRLGNGTQKTYFPQSRINNASVQYSRNLDADAMALEMYCNASNYNPYFVLPELAFDLTDAALHFWGRGTYFYPLSNTSYIGRLHDANATFINKLVIGVIKDVDDLSTFTPLDTVTYDYVWETTNGVYSNDDPTGNSYWVEYFIPLKDYVGKGRIAILHPGQPKSSSRFYIDDLDILPIEKCLVPGNFKVENIGANSMDLKWMVTSNDNFQVQMSTDAEFNTILVDTILENSDGTYHATNLMPGTGYYYKVAAICSETERSDWGVTSKYTTNFSVCYNEDFTIKSAYPTHWLRSQDNVDTVFVYGLTPKEIVETATNSWMHSMTEHDMSVSTGSMTSAIEVTRVYNDWLITPIIDLRSLDAKQLVKLTFDVKLTASGSATTFNNPSPNDRFIVAVSEDGGATYTMDNASIWAMKNGTYSYSELTAEFVNKNLDMNKYIGKQITIAFIHTCLVNSTVGAANNILHLDNVRVNTYVVDEYSSDICCWIDYEDKYFSIDAAELKANTTATYEKYVTTTTGDDIYATLHLTVNPDNATYLTDVVCEGSGYSKDGFNIAEVNQSGIYKQKLSNANACDSIVVLDLSIIPIVHDTISATICQGSYYEFGGVKYFANTIQTQTFTAQTTGCDSVVTLVLEVSQLKVGEETINLCPGDVYHSVSLGDITTSGTYADTIKVANSCDSIAMLHIFAREAVNTTIRAAICSGDSYSEGAFTGLRTAGDYTAQGQTVYGCDSLVTLHLLVAEDGILSDKITANELPYVLNGEELLPLGTANGTYTKTVMLPCGQVTITIIVGEGSALDNINGNAANIRKVVVDDKVFIIVNDTWYDVLGNKVEAQR